MGGRDGADVGGGIEEAEQCVEKTMALFHKNSVAMCCHFFFWNDDLVIHSSEVGQLLR